MDERHGDERAQRDRERSAEAHWQVAEAGAEDVEPGAGGAEKPAQQQDDPEPEGTGE